MRTITTRLMMTLAVMLLGVATVFGQGVTTSSINGRVVDTNGEPLIGANILAVHTPSGTTYGNSTDLDGFYRIPGMRVGGPYMITISYTGYAEEEYNNVYLQLGQSLKVDAELSESATTIEGVEVVAARNDIFDGNRTGAETVIGEETINKLPTVARALGDFTRLTPQSTSREGSDGFTLSFNGMNNRYNAIYIDGAVNNDVFGLAGSGTNGGQTGVSPISVDAIEEFQISLAPFDVRVGGFAGAAINAVTRSGTNNTEASVYGFYRNQALAGLTPTDDEAAERTALNDFNAYTAGFRIGGALIKDKLFYFVNAEIQRDVTPLPFDPSTYIGDATADDLNDLVRKLEGFGYDPGTYVDNERFLNSEKVTVKFDYNLNQNNKLALRHGWVRADNLEGVQSNPSSIRFLNSSERFLSNTNSTSLEWNAIIGSKMSNNLTLGYTYVDDDRDQNGDEFPYVFIDDGSGGIQFGSEQFSTANLLQQSVFTITDNFEIYSGRHNITIGTHNEFYGVRNTFIPFNFGSYEFASLADFLNDGAPSDYIRSFSLVDNELGDNTDAAAIFNAGQLGLYVQDEYQATDNFRVTLGLRVDLPFYADVPVNEDFNNNTIPALEARGYDLRGAQTGQFIEPQLQFSPRLGFNWDVTGNKETQVRGGVGIFTSRSPLVWVGGAYNNYGLNRGTIIGGVDQFIPDPANQPPGEIDPNNPTPSGDIDLFAADFRLPQFLKANLALDQKLPWGVIMTVEGSYNKTLINVAYQNVNLKPSLNTLTGTGDDRIIYNRFDRIDPTYGGIYLGYNTSEGYAYDGTISFNKPFDNGFQGTLAYSYGDAFSVFDGTSSQNSSQWRGQHAVDGRNFDQVLARSDFSQGSRVIAGLSYELGWNEDKTLKTTFSLFHESVQGQPYSYIYNDNGRLNNEDSRERNLIYVPADINDIYLADADGNLLDAAAEQAVWDQLNAFIENDPYLSERRGMYAERNASRGPWQHVMDFRLLQDVSFMAGEKKHTFQLSLDIFNFTNLLNKNWGRRYFVGSFGNFELLDFEGLQDIDGAGKNTPTFSFNPSRLNEDNEPARFIDDAGIQSSRWQMQLGIRYILK